MNTDKCSSCNKISHTKDGLCGRCRNLEELSEAYLKDEAEDREIQSRISRELEEK